MNAVFLKLLDMSLDASWLIAAVILLRFALKKSPKWINGILWAIVAIRLICPFSFESPLSLVPHKEITHSVSSVSVQNTESAASSESFNEVTAIDSTLNSAQSGGITSASDSDSKTVQASELPLGILWAAGLAAMLIFALISFLRLRSKLLEAVPVGKNIWICDAVRSPFILGMVKPRIYLSSSIDPAQIDYVIAHEKAHLSRGDHWWKPLGYLLLSVYWFNPMVWAAYILFCRDIELACDEKVIYNFDMNEKKAYSYTLLSCGMQKKMILTYPLAFGEVGIKKKGQFRAGLQKAGVMADTRGCFSLHYRGPVFFHKSGLRHT